MTKKPYIISVCILFMVVLSITIAGCTMRKVTPDPSVSPVATINATPVAITPSPTQVAVPTATVTPTAVPTKEPILSDNRVTGIVIDKGVTPYSDATLPIIRLNSITGPYSASEIASRLNTPFQGSPGEILALVNRTVWNQISVGDKVLLQVYPEGFPLVLGKIE